MQGMCKGVVAILFVDYFFFLFYFGFSNPIHWLVVTEIKFGVGVYKMSDLCDLRTQCDWKYFDWMADGQMLK